MRDHGVRKLESVLVAVTVRWCNEAMVQEEVKTVSLVGVFRTRKAFWFAKGITTMATKEDGKERTRSSSIRSE